MARKNEQITLKEVIDQIEKAAEFDAAADRWTLQAVQSVGNHTIHTARFTGIAALIDHHQKAIDKGNAAAARRFGRALELLNIGLFHSPIDIEKGKRNTRIIHQYTIYVRDIADRDAVINGLPTEKEARKAARSILTENWHTFREFIGENLWDLENVQIKYSKRTKTIEERGQDLAAQLDKFLELTDMDLHDFARRYGIAIPIEKEEEEKAAA